MKYTIEPPNPRLARKRGINAKRGGGAVGTIVFGTGTIVFGTILAVAGVVLTAVVFGLFVAGPAMLLLGWLNASGVAWLPALGFWQTFGFAVLLRLLIPSTGK